MQDYSVLFPKRFRTKKFSDKEQLNIIKKLLSAGRTPTQTILCITIFLLSVRK